MTEGTRWYEVITNMF